MIKLAMLVAQVALIAASIRCGGPSTSVGAGLLLASLWCMGASIGWLVHGRNERNDEKVAKQ